MENFGFGSDMSGWEPIDRSPSMTRGKRGDKTTEFAEGLELSNRESSQGTAGVTVQSAWIILEILKS